MSGTTAPVTARERDFSAKQRTAMADKGQALPDGSFPIATASDLSNAVSALGRAKNAAAAKAHIIKRAKALGLTASLPDDWNVKESSVPPEVTLSEAVILLDAQPVRAQVITVPGGDTIVVPEWTGAFYYGAKPFEPPTEGGTSPEGMDYSAKWDAQDATAVLSSLIGLRAEEEPGQIAQLDKAIGAVTDFIKAEVAEMPAMCAGCDHAVSCDCTTCDCTADVHMAAATSEAQTAARQITDGIARLTEVGKRHSAKDAAVLQQIADGLKALGFTLPEPAPDPVTPEVEPETTVEEAATPEDIRFRESSFDSAAVINLREAAPVFDDESRSVWITPIKPGFGNARDNFYYPRDTIHEAASGGLFDGLKMYRDHPRKSDERELPERSVKDWFATTKETAWDDATGWPRVRVQVHEQSDYARWKDAPEQIAFSILGGGLARPGNVDGRSTRVVESFKKINSVDWVTEAGAGGGLTFAESAAGEDIDMDLKDITAEQLAEANPDLVAAIKAAALAEAKDPEPEPEPEPTPEPEPVAAAESMPAWFAPFASKIEAIDARESAIAQATVLAESKAPAKTLVDAAIAESTLTAKAKAHVAGKFADVTIGEGGAYATEDALREAVTRELASTLDLMKAMFGDKSQVTGLGAAAAPADGEVSTREAVAADLDKAFSLGAQAIPAKRKTVFLPGEDVTDTLHVVGAGHRETTAPDGGPTTPDDGPANLSEAGQAVLADMLKG